MAQFCDVEAEEPEFAARVRAAFDAHRHKFLGTLRADGSPRISGLEMAFVAGEPWLAGMPDSVKFADLRRDPRFALHSGSSEPDVWEGDAKLSGRAAEVTDPGMPASHGSPATKSISMPLIRGDPSRRRVARYLCLRASKAARTRAAKSGSCDTTSAKVAMRHSAPGHRQVGLSSSRERPPGPGTSR